MKLKLVQKIKDVKPVHCKHILCYSALLLSNSSKWNLHSGLEGIWHSLTFDSCERDVGSRVQRKKADGELFMVLYGAVLEKYVGGTWVFFSTSVSFFILIFHYTSEGKYLLFNPLQLFDIYSKAGDVYKSCDLLKVLPTY